MISTIPMPFYSFTVYPNAVEKNAVIPNKTTDHHNTSNYLYKQTKKKQNGVSIPFKIKALNL